MGVLACNRRGCENIMCGRLSHRFGYICGECFNELVELGSRANIGMFMETEKAAVPAPTIDLEALARERFEAEFSDG